METGQGGEDGLYVPWLVEEDYNPDPELVATQLPQMVDRLVLA